MKHQPYRCMRSGGTAPPFLTSAVEEDEWSASRPSPLLPRTITDTNWMEDWLVPEPVWTLCSKENSPDPAENQSQTDHAVVIPTELSWIPFIFVKASNYCTYYRSKTKSDRKMGYIPFDSTKIHTWAITFYVSCDVHKSEPGRFRAWNFLPFCNTVFLVKYAHFLSTGSREEWN
jgi:hypothetical protein